MIHLIGYTYDTLTTHSTLLLKRQFDRHELDFPLTETNPLLPDHPTLNDQLFGKNTFLMLLLFSADLVFPSFGLATGLAHVLAGHGNLNQKRRLQVSLKSLNL